ncbi:MAG: thioredoxin family protein [Oscillospiraceae bacterium]|nr:thioredoxin family protein [Oscillospiraceae bacterium]
MALFGFGKKKEEKASACCCGEEKTAPCCGGEEKAASCCGRPVSGICCVKVLGAGCKSCHELYENTRSAVQALGLSVEVEYVTDMQKIAAFGVISMPAIVVNDRVVSAGRVLRAAEVEKLLRELTK